MVSLRLQITTNEETFCIAQRIGTVLSSTLATPLLILVIFPTFVLVL